MEILKGIPVASGYAIAPAFVLDSEQYRITRRKIQRVEVEREIVRFESAVEASKNDLLEMKRQWSDRVGKRLSELFDSHILVFEDRRILGEIKRRIEEDSFSPEYAVSRVFRKYAKLFLELGDGYFRQRVGDLHDVERRLLRNLLGEKMETLTTLQEQVVIIAQDLSPSQTASLDRQKVVGFATDTGGMTSHTAILAKALDIPAVVGLGTISNNVSGGDRVIIDGNTGNVIINPDEETVKKYRALERNFTEFEKKLNKELLHLPAQTKDGKGAVLLANIEFPGEVDFALKHGAQGVGLYRSEFLFKGAREPDETEHFEAYRRPAELLGSKPLVVRTFDLGGDKQMGRNAAVEPNPILGCRSIRYSFLHLDSFKAQLRGILRASAFGNVRILFPMIASVEDLLRAKMYLEDAKEELRAKGMRFNEKIPVGAMIEVPSAALTADLLARHVDFFSIGTNDLIQYLLAVDRVNERVADLYQPAHPAMLRLLSELIECGRRHKIPVTICGEIAGDAMFTLLLLGIGADEFSLAPALIPEIKKIIRSVTLAEAQEIARQALEFHQGHETAAFLRKKVQSIVPEAF